MLVFCQGLGNCHGILSCLGLHVFKCHGFWICHGICGCVIGFKFQVSWVWGLSWDSSGSNVIGLGFVMVFVMGFYGLV